MFTWDIKSDGEVDNASAREFDDDDREIDMRPSGWLFTPLRDGEVYTSSFLYDRTVPKVTIYSEDKQPKWIVNSRYLSRLSETLAGAFAWSPGSSYEDPCIELPGISRLLEEEAFQLEDVTTDEFDIFLDTLRASSLQEFSYGDLKIILRLASDWGLNKLRTQSKVRLRNLHLDPLDKVSLGRRCKIAEWVRQAYLYLVLRAAPLSDADAWVLGATATSIIRHAREEVSTYREQVLESEESLSWGSGCTRKNCQETLREAWFWVQDGRLNEDTEATIISRILAEASEEGKDLCFVCKKEIGVRDWLRGMAEEYELARAVLTHFLGTEDSRWLQPALSHHSPD